MSKRTVHTTITPLPAGLSRQTVMSTLRNHVEMIDLNPLVIERHAIPSPPHATPEETLATWYSITDRITYVPGLASSNVTYTGCFHDLPDGLQTHVHAPMGLDIRSRWLLGGSLPGEPAQPMELGLGIPRQGLWLREDVDMKCNVILTGFVKKTIRKAHGVLVERLLAKAHRTEESLSSVGAGEHQQPPWQIPSPPANAAGSAAGSVGHSSDGHYHGKPQYQKPLPDTPPNPLSQSAAAGQSNGSLNGASEYSLAATNNLDHYPRPVSNPRHSQPYVVNHDRTPSRHTSPPVDLLAQRDDKRPLELPA